MLRSWAAFAFPFTDDDSLLLPSPEFDDDDPSSYLLYPPGFGPVVDWVAPPATNQKGADLVVGGGRGGVAMDGSVLELVELGKPGGGGMTEEGRCLGGSGALELLGLSEALSGKVSLVGDSGCVEKDGIVEYMVIGSLEKDGDAEPGVCDPDNGGSRASGDGVSGDCGRSLGNGVREAPPDSPGVKAKEAEADGGGDDSGSYEEANLRIGGSVEAESDDSSSSSTSSEEDDEEEEEEDESDEDADDEDGDERDGGKGRKVNGAVEIEEGEIKDMDAEEFGLCSDDDDDGGTKGPIRSKHEVEVLPPVPPVNATLEPRHQTLPVGTVSSIIGTKVIVEGVENHNPLNEGSILWITETRSPLGIVDEIFGPVKNPFYLVRVNSEKEIPTGISEGTAISFVMEFADHILNDPVLYKKGYDASGEHDEEVSDEVEFSDDEKEAEYRRSLREGKRGMDNRRQSDHESTGKKRVQFDKRRLQNKTPGFGKRNDVQPLASSALGPISQPPNITSQLQSTLRKPLGHGAFPLISQPPNVPSQIQSISQQHFNPRQAQGPPQPAFVPGQVQTPSQLPCAVGQVQPPSQPPPVLGQVRAPPPQHCVPNQALQESLQQSCAPGQLQAPTSSPYFLGPLQASTPPSCVGLPQVSPFANNVGCGDLASFVGGLPYFNWTPTVPAIPFGGQPGGPFGVTQQNVLMPQSNAVWANQQLITGLSGLFPNNGMPCQQQQDHHPFHQNQFPSFNNGMPFQHQLMANQGIPPNIMPWQGGLPNPSICPRPLEPTVQDSHGQAQSGHIRTGERGAFGLSSGNQNSGQFGAATVQSDMHAPMKFSSGNSSIRGRKPYGRGGGRTRRS